MSWDVRVRWVELPRAVCLDCDPVWQGPVRLTEARAERDSERHRLQHVQEWEKLNEEWDRG